MRLPIPCSIAMLIILASMLSCSKTKTENKENVEKRQYVQQQNPVRIIILEKGPFQKELVNNGKLAAFRKSELRFRVSEQLEEVAVKNGDKVRAGQLIASLTPFTYSQERHRADLQVQQAYLSLQNLLIGQGYNTTDSALIPQNIYQVATIKSGYAQALQALETARFNEESTHLTAPFAGIVANIVQKKHEQVSSGATFCTLIDDSEFEVQFRVVENEIADIRLGDEAHIIPFSDATRSYRASISEINPMIDANGLILVKAIVRNTGDLMEGMNVKVLVEKEIADQLVVPKSAVVLRQNQEVLFVYKNKTAFWTYVQTLAENSSSYAVIAHPDKGGTLAPGDTIIVSGNLNLAHESEVAIE